MGIVAMSDLDRLFWAGRYCARAVGIYEKFVSLPSDDSVRADFARRLGLCCEGFGAEIAVLGENGTVCTSVYEWLFNAESLRHCLGSRAVMRAQIAAEIVKKGEFCELPTQAYAFFGIVSDRLTDRVARCAVEAGRTSERLDIAARLGEEKYLLEDALLRLRAACDESEAVRALIDDGALRMIENEIDGGDTERIALYTPYLENEFELS